MISNVGWSGELPFQVARLDLAEVEEQGDDYSSSSLSFSPIAIDWAAFMPKRDLPKGFHMQLHDAIKSEHEAARKNDFLNSLIEGGLGFCSKAYVAYLCNLFALHEGIEKAQKRIVAEHGEGFFVFPILFRSEQLLNDIKMWSIFNPFSAKFADGDISSEGYKDAVRSVMEPCTREFVGNLERLPSISVVGVLYVLYGTIMAGGQRVKGGVMSGFIERSNSSATYAQKSVSFFSFSDDFSIPRFKQEWHANLDELPSKVKGKKEITDAIIHQAKQTMVLVQDFIASMLKNIDNY